MPNEKERLAIDPQEAYAGPLGYAIACLEEERKRTQAAVAGLATAALDGYADGFSNSIGSLLYHVAAVELDWLYVEILEQEIPAELTALFPLDVRDAQGRLSVIAGVDLEEHLERLARVRKALLESLKDLDEAEFYRLRSFPHYDVNPAWVLYHLLEHEAKHGDQMARIRRLVS